jgi:hypothetical protein
VLHPGHGLHPHPELHKHQQPHYWGSAEWQKSYGLRTYVEGLFGSLKNPDTERVSRGLRATATWVMDAERIYTYGARTEFLAKADYYFVAQAAAMGATVITTELSDPRSKKRVKIPDVCVALGVPYASPFTMLRNEGVRFVSP